MASMKLNKTFPNTLFSGQAKTAPPDQPNLSIQLNLLLALIAGVAQANLYWSQFIQSRVADAFGVSRSRIGLIVSLSQAGHALGLLFVTPLGDILRCRLLSLCLCSASAFLLLGLSLTRSLTLFYALNFLLGIMSVLPQFMIPMAARLAPSEQRGRAIGLVVGGLMMGILYARLGSGIIETYAGWRAVYYQAAGITALTFILILAFFPDVPSRNNMSYGQLMRSLWGLLRNEPVLQKTCVLGACLFISYMLYWSDLTFLLSKAPFRFKSSFIGLFALIGITGIAVAPLAGRMGDRYGSFKMGAIGIDLLIVSAAIMWVWGDRHLPAVVVGGILLDMGFQLSQVANQIRIFAINPAAQSRINSIYMVSCFLGASAGSQSGAALMEAMGWKGAMMLSICVVVLAMRIHLYRNPETNHQDNGAK